MMNNKKGFIEMALMILGVILAILIFINFAPILNVFAADGITQTTDGLTQFMLASLSIVAFLIMIWLVVVKGVQ